MNFESIHIQGFGCLVERSFDCLPGLNIFYGPNEAGKSTLQQAIWALLYGFFSGNRKLAAETALLERYRPWSGTRYAGHLVYRLGAGSAFRVVRVFDEDLSTVVYDADTGRDVTNQFERGRLGRVQFAHEHFGLSQEVFVNTCFVRQADLHHLTEAALAISETVVNLSGTGSQDRSVKRALELLDKAFDEQVGSPRAKTKPLPRAEARLSDLQDEVQRIRDRQHDLESEHERHSNLAHRRDQLAEEIVRLDLLIALTQRDRFVHIIDAAIKLRGKIDENRLGLAELAGVIDFPLELREIVNRLFQEWTGYSRAFEIGTTELEASRPEATELKRRRADLLNTIGYLEVARSIAVDQENEVRKLEARWREATGALAPLEEAMEAAQAAVNELEFVRASTAQRPVLTGPELQSLHDLGTSLEAAERDLSSAERDVDQAQKNLNLTSLTPDRYEALDARLKNLSPARISELKEREAQLTHSAEKLGANSVSQHGNILALATGMLGVAGVFMLALGLAQNISSAMLIGSVMVALAGVAVVTLVVRRNQLYSAKMAMTDVATALRAQLDQYDCESAAKLERTYLDYMAAQPAYNQLIRSRAVFEQKRKTTEEIREHGRAVLDLSSETEVSVEILRRAESDARRIAEQTSELLRRERARDQLSPNLRAVKDRLHLSEQTLREALLSARLEDGDLSQAIARYYDLCDKWRQLEKADAQLAMIDAKLERFARGEIEARNAKIGLDSTEAELRRNLRLAGIDEPDLRQAMDVFEAKCELAKTALRIQAEVDNQSRELKALLGAYSLEQLNRRREELSLKVDAILAAHPEWQELISTDSEHELQERLEAMRNESMTTRQELAGLEERLAGGLRGLRQLVDVEEEIEATERTIATLALYGEALELAQQQLTDAADEHQRNFLPRLNRLVGQSVSQVTGGRYGNLQIDHSDLQVRLQIPNLLHPVTPEVLSRGAQEQIYLMLRLGLTELMSNGREKLPLLLDDPLVNYDRERLQLGLDFLAEVAEHGQVLLFTKDDETIRWFQTRHEHSRIHKIHNLS